MPTQKYVVLLRRIPSEQERPSPAKAREMYAAFDAWRDKFKANIVDLGGQLKPGGKILRTSGVTDGPYAEAKEVVAGFMVIAGESYDRAVEIGRECPGVVRPGARVEIREIATQ